MLLSSSLPAQAPSAIGSSRIAARFADIPKCNSFLMVRPSALLIALRRILDRPPAKWNWYLAHSGKRPDYRKKSAGPQPLGKQWREPVLISTVAAGQRGANHARGSVSAALNGGGPRVFSGLFGP